MRNPFQLIARWILRHLVGFFVIIAVLVSGHWLVEEVRAFGQLTTELANLRNIEHQAKAIGESLRVNAEDRVARIDRSSEIKLNARISEIDKDIGLKLSEKAKRSNLSLLLSLPSGKAFLDRFKQDIELDVLQQERGFLSSLRDIAAARRGLEAARVERERRRKIQATVYADLKDVAAQLEQLESAGIWPFRYFQNRAERKAFVDKLAKLYKENQDAYDNWASQDRIVSMLDRLSKGKPKNFSVDTGKVEEAVRELAETIHTREASLPKNWLSKISEPVNEWAPTAAWILVAVILTPFGIKLFFYFVLAPWASRRPPICLLPGTSGAIGSAPGNPDRPEGMQRISSVSQAVVLEESEELLVLPEYIQSSSVDAKKSTQWLLDWAYPLSSVVAGMFALTRVRTARRDSITVSATKEDPLSEFGVLSLPADSAIVFQPRNLVGVVYPRGMPVKIERKWRFGLHAWLTLQFRYLIFRGPAKLIVKGCRGVCVEQAGNGRLINQVATLGFSANVEYSTVRCETFVSYLTGEEELFNDRFSGDSGFYVYEEMPHFGKATGMTGRWLEGLSDTVLKVFGI